MSATLVMPAAGMARRRLAVCRFFQLCFFCVEGVIAVVAGVVVVLIVVTADGVVLSL